MFTTKLNIFKTILSTSQKPFKAPYFSACNLSTSLKLRRSNSKSDKNQIAQEINEDDNELPKDIQDTFKRINEEFLKMPTRDMYSINSVIDDNMLERYENINTNIRKERREVEDIAAIAFSGNDETERKHVEKVKNSERKNKKKKTKLNSDHKISQADKLLK